MDKIWDSIFHGESQRLDSWLAGQLPQLSRAKIQKLIGRHKILVNGRLAKASLKVQTGDRIHVEIENEAPSPRLLPYPMSLDILYEDSELLVLNKAAGITVHPGAGTSAPTLVEGVLHWLGKKDGGEHLRPGIVHRLDKDTTGLMVYAKNERTQFNLAKQFAAKQIPREYLALLDGYLEQPKLEYESYLFRDHQNRQRFASITKDTYLVRFGHPPQGGYRWAKSIFTKECSYLSRLSLAKIQLLTGRTHQIRVHSKALQCPVLGDPLYNQPHELPKAFPLAVRQSIASLKRQMLHARKLGFLHPLSGKELSFEAPPPQDFQELIDLLAPFKDEKEG